MNRELLATNQIYTRLDTEPKTGGRNYIMALEDYCLPNYRLDGLRKLLSVGAQIPSPLYVIGHDSFVLFKEDPAGFVDRISDELGNLAYEVASQSNKASISLRRAYMVPDEQTGSYLTNPKGPRYLGVAPERLPEKIYDLFDNAIKLGYDKTGAQIAGFFYPFIDPDNKPLEEIGEEDKLPFGGHVIIGESTCEILVAWGNNETVIYQEDNGIPIETYEVTFDGNNQRRVEIVGKNIVPKNLMHYTGRDGKSGMVTVPLSHQLGPILYDSEIVDLVRALNPVELVKRYGPQRVEFSSNGDRAIFNESTDLEKSKDEEEKQIEASGKVIKIATPLDVARLAALTPDQFGLVLPYYVDRSREGITGSLLVRQFSGRPLTVLIAGKNNVSHDAKLFNDAGFSPIAIGKQNLAEGDEVIVRLKKGVVNVENKATNSIIEAVPLSIAHKRGLGQIGGKAERLSILEQQGFSVPNGIVLTTEFFDQVINNEIINKVWAKLREGQLRDVLPELLTEIPAGIWGKVSPLAERFGLLDSQAFVIARSSANIEDARGRSFAGRFKSVPFAKGELAVQQAVLECLHSCYNPRVLGYLESLSLQQMSEIKLAVIVQEMVNAEVSGVLFAGDISTGNTKKIIIEARQGLASEIVDGHGYDEKLLIDKSKRKVEGQDGVTLLTNSQINYLVSLSERLEKIFEYPQDIEWSIDKEGKVWIVQSRDL